MNISPKRFEPFRILFFDLQNQFGIVQIFQPNSEIKNVSFFELSLWTTNDKSS